MHLIIQNLEVKIYAV